MSRITTRQDGNSRPIALPRPCTVAPAGCTADSEPVTVWAQVVTTRSSSVAFPRPRAARSRTRRSRPAVSPVPASQNTMRDPSAKAAPVWPSNLTRLSAPTTISGSLAEPASAARCTHTGRKLLGAAASGSAAREAAAPRIWNPVQWMAGFPAASAIVRSTRSAPVRRARMKHPVEGGGVRMSIAATPVG